jgi:hypothetical protein
MAKSGKTVQLFQKPENFIKTRARELQLGNCYISPDWEESGIANILVSRKHTNGNFTIGFYLVDLKCLGIKDAFFKFNVSDDEMFELVDYVNGEEIEYSQAHNIIYGAEAFANDCGFKPHKDWAVAQYILEEDDDHIPLIDIEFGEAGVPAYYVGPNDNPAKIKQILATLDKNVGAGNYLFYENDEFEEGELNGFGNEEISDFKQIYFDLINDYYNDVRFNNTTNLDNDLIVEVLNNMVDTTFYSVNEDLDNEIIECIDLNQHIFEEQSNESLSQIQKLLVKNPDNPYFYIELFLQYKLANLNYKANEIAQKGLTLFPDFLYLRIFVAHAAIIDQELEKGFELLNSQYYLNQAFPQRTSFSEGEFMFFYAALCQYFLGKDNLEDAIVCSAILINNIYTYECNENAVLGVMEAVKNRMEGRN